MADNDHNNEKDKEEQKQDVSDETGLRHLRIRLKNPAMQAKARKREAAPVPA